MPELGLYSLQEAAQYLGVTIQEVVNFINNGELKAYRLKERRTRIDEYDLLQFAKKRQNDLARPYSSDSTEGWRHTKPERWC